MRFESNFQSKGIHSSYLRVLLAKWPDIWEPIFGGQCIYGCIIKSNYLGDVPKAKSWDLRAHTGLWGAIQVLGLK